MQAINPPSSVGRCVENSSNEQVLHALLIFSLFCLPSFTPNTPSWTESFEQGSKTTWKLSFSFSGGERERKCLWSALSTGTRKKTRERREEEKKNPKRGIYRKTERSCSLAEWRRFLSRPSPYWRTLGSPPWQHHCPEGNWFCQAAQSILRSRVSFFKELL